MIDRAAGREQPPASLLTDADGLSPIFLQLKEAMEAVLAPYADKSEFPHALRQAVGPHGTVIAVDLTPEMLRHARTRGRAAHATLILADARHRSGSRCGVS